MYQSSLSINPSNTDWENIDVSLITSARVTHHPRVFTEDNPRSAHYIEVVQQYYAGGVDIQAVHSTFPEGNYLSIVPYNIGDWGTMCRVASYQAYCAEQQRQDMLEICTTIQEKANYLFSKLT